MKKKVCGGIIVLAIVAITIFNLNINAENRNAILLTLANVEALASGESEGFFTCETAYDSDREDKEEECWDETTKKYIKKTQVSMITFKYSCSVIIPLAGECLSGSKSYFYCCGSLCGSSNNVKTVNCGL